MRSLTVIVAAVCCVGLSTPAAEAHRKAKSAEATGIKRATLAQCGTGQRCRFERARVSTVNARYAFGDASGRDYGVTVILRRRSAKATRWTRVTSIGGGAPDCRQFRSMPRAVVREFGLGGLRDGRYVDQC